MKENSQRKTTKQQLQVQLQQRGGRSPPSRGRFGEEGSESYLVESDHEGGGAERVEEQDEEGWNSTSSPRTSTSPSFLALAAPAAPPSPRTGSGILGDILTRSRRFSGSMNAESIPGSTDSFGRSSHVSPLLLPHNTTSTMIETARTLDFSSLGLYGIEEQIQKLKERWEASKTSRQLVLISGDAGSGKSSLLQHFQRHIFAPAANTSAAADLRTHTSSSNNSAPARSSTDEEEEDDPRAVLLRPAERQSLYAVGKFDQQQRDHEPYAGIATACNGLCQGILELRYAAFSSGCDQNQFHTIQARLLEAVGDYSDVLTTVVPKLHQLLQIEREQEQEQEQAEVSTATISSPSLDPAPVNATTRRGRTSPPGATRSMAKTNTSSSPQSTSDGGAGYLDSKYLFTRAFLSFIRVVVECYGPMVLALDDLQWADQSSLDLIAAILSDAENPAILIVGTYRNEGITGGNSPLSKFVLDFESMSGEQVDPITTTLLSDKSSSGRSPEQEKLSFCQLHVGNLDTNHIGQLLEDLLKLERRKVESLAQCVYRKTLGNAFFVKQFLRLLHAQGLLIHTASEQGGVDQDAWCWDVETITVKTSATENVGDLMVSKLKSMSSGVRHLIPMVASLGSVFSRTFLQLVVERFGILLDVDEDCEETFGPDDFLRECEAECLICSLPDDHYGWEHDKIQEAALSLVEISRRDSLQFELGNLLLTRLTASELDQHIFFVANLLGDSVWLSADDPHRIEVVQVLLKAGMKAAKISSFELAAHYLRRGIDLLPPDYWKYHRRLGLELYSSAAEAELCLGHFEKMEAFCNEILGRRFPVLDKRRAYTALQRSYRAQGKFDMARLLCTEVLATYFDFHLPKRGSLRAKLQTISSVVWLKLCSTDRFMKRLERAGTIDDETIKWREELVDDLAFAVAQDCPDMGPLVLMKGVQSMMKDGASEYSIITLYSVGYLQSMLGDYAKARIYAEKALSLLSSQDRGSKKVEPRCMLVTNLFLLPWQISLQLCRKGLLRGYHAGINSGDTENAGWCIYSYLENAFHSGAMDLGTIADHCRLYSAQMKELKQNKIAGFIWLMWNVAHNLATKDDEEFTNPRYCDKICSVLYADFREDAHFLIHRKRLDLHESFWLREYGRFLEIVETIRFDQGVYERDYPGVAPGIYTMHFHLALVGFICAKDESMSRRAKRKCKSLRRKFHRKIKTYAKKGNPNVIHYDLLLEAETAALKKDQRDAATRYFNEAILRARDCGFRQDEALAYERFAQYLLDSSLAGAEKGRQSGGQHQQQEDTEKKMRSAIQLYEEHGMRARAHVLALKYAAIFGSSGPPLEISL